jgi:hypothetical protein
MNKTLIIHTKDVQIITGKCEKTSRNMISLCRDALGKAKYQLITIGEFCKYFGLDPKEVTENIR